MTGMGSHQSAAAASVVWLTPPHILEALGPFDLDPCAQPGWKTAEAGFTEAEDGLAHDWFGRVWLNPPYTSADLSAWMDRLVDHGQGTALIFARTETATFARTVWGEATGVLFLEGRLHFHHADGTRARANAGAPSVLVAYGQDDAEVLAASSLKGAFVPLRLPRGFAVVLPAISWTQLVREVIEREGGKVSVSDLYRALQRHPKARDRAHWRAKVRQTLQRGGFQRIERGLWAA